MTASYAKEIKYRGEGSAASILQGYKLLTLRVARPEYENIPRGEVVQAVCEDDGASFPTRVLDVVTSPLNKMPLGLLALDGFFDYGVCVRDMRKYYDNFSSRTKVTGIAIMEDSRFNSIPNYEVQKELVTRPMADIFSDPDFNWLIMPSVLQWFLERYPDANLASWIEKAKELDLITDKRRQKITEILGDKIIDGFRYNDRLQMALSQRRLGIYSGDFYNQIVLLKAD